MSTQSSQTQVLIVGAGPTGLTLANVLSRYGVRTRIVERKPQLSRYTKASNLMQRSLEIFSALGVLDEIRALGGNMSRMMVHSYGKCYGPRTMHLEESPFHDVLLCGQHNVERVLAQALAMGGDSAVEFDTTLTGLEHDDRSARARLERAGAIEEVACDFLIGCDGAMGASRTFTKLDFTPTKTGVILRQADCTLSWRRLATMDQMWLFYFDHGFAVIVPLPGGVHRVITVEPKTSVPNREPTLDELQAKLRTVTDDDSLTLRDPEWLSFSDLSMGIAPGLRDGRVLLAGDAGNPILPNGGQGMNTGISDAFNLGLKLASVIRDNAPIALLDTYEHERLTLRKAMENAQFNSLKYTTLVTPKFVQLLFGFVMEPALDNGLERAMARGFSQLASTTRNSRLTLERGRGKGLRAGDRALDADVTDGERTTTLYHSLYRGGWTLLAFTGTRNAGGSEIDAALAAFDRPDVATLVLTTSSRFAARDARHTVLFDLDELAHRTYGVARPTLYLVRPDGYIGARVGPRDVAEMGAYAERWLPRSRAAMALALA